MELNRIYNVHCLEFMKTLPDKCIDLCLTDPPYRDEKENAPTKDMRDNNWVKKFGDKPNKELLDQIFRVSKNQIIWGANNFELPPYKGFIVWEKDIPMDFTMSMAEIAYISEGLGTISKIFKLRIAGLEDRVHPTQKPIRLGEWILERYAKEGDVIFDPFAGSGTFLVASQNLGFKYIGCELDKEYFEIAQERLGYVKQRLF
jgi:site-specific DNA-methyltransferase (adenine-specific)